MKRASDRHNNTHTHTITHSFYYSSRLRLLTPDREHQIRVVVVVTTLLLGPLDLGNQLIAREGMLEMMLVMAGIDDVLQQKVRSREVMRSIYRRLEKELNK